VEEGDLRRRGGGNDRGGGDLVEDFRTCQGDVSRVQYRVQSGGGTFIDVEDAEEDGFDHCEAAGATVAAKAQKCRSYMIVV
jgi:hypothetical protein